MTREIAIVNLQDVQPEPVTWCWPDRIPQGKLSIIIGDPKTGKSAMTMDMAARVSAGTPWPDLRDKPNPAGGVVILTAEDDLADTVRPRLDAAGADVSKVRAIVGTTWVDEENGESGRRWFTLDTDLDLLRVAIKNTPECKLVIIDPISAYLGEADSHKNADIRAILSPLAELAAEERVSVVAVTHMTKASNSNVLYRAMGSLGFVAAARAIWFVARDTENPARRLFLPAGGNCAPDGVTGLAFSLHNDGGVPVVAWDASPVTADIADYLNPDGRSGGGRTGEVADAAGWLRDLLADGQPMKSDEVKTQAREAGISMAAVKRAKRSAGVVVRKIGFGDGAGWYWRIPKTEGAHEDAHDPPDKNTCAPSSHFERLRAGGVKNGGSEGVEDAEGAEDAQPVCLSTFDESEHLGDREVVEL